MIRRLLVPVLAVFALTHAAHAAPPERLDELIAALRLPDVMAVMSQEGIAYGDRLEAKMFPGRGGERWKAAVATIYDTGPLNQTMARILGEDLSGADLAPLIDFFGAPLGRRITGLEISARRALLDPSVEDANREVWNQMRAGADPRLSGLADFVAANDMIELNVAGELNANYAFFSGLSAGGAFARKVTEGQMLAKVRSQEPQVRRDTMAWIFPYLALAYRPLSDQELKAYTDLSLTPEGRALNRALFHGFDAMFTAISRQLGQGAARVLSGQDI